MRANFSMTARAAAYCSSPKKVIAVCIVHTVIPSAHPYKRESAAVEIASPRSNVFKLSNSAGDGTYADPDSID